MCVSVRFAGVVMYAIGAAACGYPALPALDDGGGGGGADGNGPGADHLVMSLRSVKLAQQQTARLHVSNVHPDGSMDDVTQAATYASDNALVVTTGMPGVIVSPDTQSGVATITASLGRATPATLKVTVTALLCHPVINELSTAGVGTSADEWVEIYNPCSVAMSVDGWTLDYRGANTTGSIDSNLMITLTGVMASGELRLFADTNHAGPNDGSWPDTNGLMGQGGGAVGLRNGPLSTGALVDAVAYGTASLANPFLEANAALAAPAGASLSRLPFDGNDTDDGTADFTITAVPTPRALNAP